MKRTTQASGSSVVRLYDELKKMAIGFQLRPGERINEAALAEALGASRTPLREALNRLVAEGFLSFERGRGFFCRSLDVAEIYNLYELRRAIECHAVRQVCLSASDEDLDKLGEFLHTTGPEPSGYTIEELVRFDEHFHERLTELSTNTEMLKVLRNVNERLAFVRWIDMEERRPTTQQEHLAILAAVIARDPEEASRLMDLHIVRRLDQITSAVREGYSRIYVPDQPTVPYARMHPDEPTA